jgi:GTP-sensing pleiotropic transcriptional regulator CodY
VLNLAVFGKLNTKIVFKNMASFSAEKAMCVLFTKKEFGNILGYFFVGETNLLNYIPS